MPNHTPNRETIRERAIERKARHTLAMAKDATMCRELAEAFANSYATRIRF